MIVDEKTLASEMIYEGKILNLRKDKVTVRDGKVSSREIIEHRGAVGIAAITSEGKMVLVKQFRKPAEKAVIEIPAGKIEVGEDDHLETASRELREETGYTAENIELLTSFYPAIGYSTEKIDIYYATELTPGETDFDPSESIVTYEYTMPELMKLVEDGTIEDAKTIIAILMVNSIK